MNEFGKEGRLNRRNVLAWAMMTSSVAALGSPLESDAFAASGEIPQVIRIDAIEVLGRVETIGIAQGVMGSPTNLAFAGWYKETSLLGQPGNAVMTGYYRWSDLPALFGNLALLVPGDEVLLTGDSGHDYRYHVEWVRTYEKRNAPLQEIVGPTEKAVLTLITDAGEFDVAANAYPRSTVVRASWVKNG